MTSLRHRRRATVGDVYITNMLETKQKILEVIYQPNPSQSVSDVISKFRGEHVFGRRPRLPRIRRRKRKMQRETSLEDLDDYEGEDFEDDVIVAAWGEDGDDEVVSSRRGSRASFYIEERDDLKVEGKTQHTHTIFSPVSATGKT